MNAKTQAQYQNIDGNDLAQFKNARGAPRHRAADSGDPDALHQIRGEPARAAACPRARRSAVAASLDRHHQGAPGALASP
jgi:hypothetical protein